MKSFNEFNEYLLEKLITFGGKAYPKFGNVVILAGGGGSGKGFIQSQLMGIQGKTFDVDALKSLAVKSDKITQRVKKELGVDLIQFKVKGALKNPETVSLLHGIIGDELKLPDKEKRAFFSSIMTADPERKPNVIFDVTLKSLQKFDNLISNVTRLGYDKKNIHLVWIINDIEIALKQNAERDRFVKPEILINTHVGAQQTVADVIKLGNKLKSYMDGDIVFVFNKVGVDTTYIKSPEKETDFKYLTTKNKKGETVKVDVSGGGGYLKDANFFYIKRAGKAVMNFDDIDKDIRAKIRNYVPKGAEW
jgi:CO dehydrogenase nickel-insertion accessory protein CooC1